MFQFANLMALLCTLGLAACGGSDSGSTVTPPPPPPPVETVQPPIVEPPPPNPTSGTLLGEGCSKDYVGVKWFQYADGDGGTYSEKDTQSEECGWTISLTAVKEIGDRFDPVVISADAEWSIDQVSSTMGIVEREGDFILVYGDGRIGEGMLTLDTTTIFFYMEEEPTCLVEDRVDCAGYRNNSRQRHIYYGEDDDRIVTWELGILQYSQLENSQPILIEDYTDIKNQYDAWERRVEQYNKIYERSGVHIRFKLKKLWLAHWQSMRGLAGLSRSLGGVDIVLGYGYSFPDTCGVATITTSFTEGRPPYSMSLCGPDVDLHEMGHSVGLAHGPENQGNQARGYIFPDFGHGYNDICGRMDDIMSYGSETVFHSNSILYCGEIFPNGLTDGNLLAGDRGFSDTAYHLNRVRYLVSLINPENDYVDPEYPLQKIRVQSSRIPLQVID